MYICIMKELLNIYVLYMHIRKSDGRIFYIGIGKKNRPYNKVGRNKHWHNTVNKHGYKVVILVENITQERAKELEILMIAFYGRKDLGLGNLVNLTDGGQGSTNFRHSKKDREQMSKDRKGVPANPVRVEKMRQTNLAKGENHHMKRPEMRELTSKRGKGKVKPYMVGDKNPMKRPEVLEKFLGDNNPAKRPEVRVKLAGTNNPKARLVVDINVGVFYSVSEAALLYNMTKYQLECFLKNKKPNKTSLRYL